MATSPLSFRGAEEGVSFLGVPNAKSGEKIRRGSTPAFSGAQKRTLRSWGFPMPSAGRKSEVASSSLLGPEEGGNCK